MQLEAADWSIQATPPVHLQGFTPTCVQYWKAANRRGQRVKTRRAPRPYQALGLGGLPSTARAARTPPPTVRRGQKTLPRQRISRPAGAHHRSAKVCIDPRCLMHTSGTA